MAKNKNPRLKPAYAETEYTLEQIQELTRCSRDPVYFIENYIYIKGMYGRALFKLFPYQKEIIKNYISNFRSIILAARQTGKSELAAAFITWYLCFHKDKTVLVTSYRAESSKEIIGKIVFAYEELPDWIKPGISENSWNKTSLAFENKCRVIADTTSENTGRGLTIDLLYVDELAHIKPHIQELFFTSVLPTLSSRIDGRMIVTSTPNGDIDLFARLWKGALAKINGFVASFAKWDDVPGRGEKYKQEMIAQFGERRFNQEFECLFISSDNTLLDTLEINILIKEIQNATPIFNIKGQDFWKPISRTMNYILGIDPATGDGNDYSVIQIFEFPTMEQVGEFRTNTTDYPDLYAHLKNILRYLEHYGKDIYFSVENNGVGQGVIALYQADENPPEKALFVSERGKDKLGFVTTDKSKMKSCLLLKEMLLNRTLKINSLLFFNELKSFIRKQGSYKAQTGATDDTISATLICLRVMEEMASYDDDAYYKLYTAGLERIEKEIENNRDWEYDDSYVPDPFIFV